MNKKERTKEFTKNLSSDQEIDLIHKSVTCPSKKGVRSRIIEYVYRGSVQRSGMCEVNRYQCMRKIVASLHAAIKTERRIFC
jgi:hypothetical protein